MRGLALLLLLGALRGCLLQNIRVSQIPAVSATEGSTVTLQCHYTLSSTEKGTAGWYRWYRHVLGGPEVSNDSGNFMGRVSRAFQNEFINNRSASIQLHRVQISDTGMFICEVTLEPNPQGHGNGTFLTVTADVTES
ncbi:natural cytotoxicity triggering receptor 3-like [Xenopus tropicalis]|uniref:Natural cytotoxicity triggering receptor 3 n=1 Tax=Xenopus tropicalis TaxID=8364 RepID=A0A8J1JH63_XENTR|nr:natural cytotoxicity triggering receptor 3-like [Xenopus tropicalis]